MFLLRPQHADRCRDQTRALCSAKLDGREWRYVAEGGANVLFRHHPPAAEVGAAKSEFYGKLLRVKKCDAVDDASAKKLRRKRSKSRSLHSAFARSGSLGGSDSEDVILPAAPYPAHYPHPTKVVEYATKDVLPYLEQQVRGNVYEQVAQLLPVDKRFLVELNEQLLTLDSRPEHRRQSQIDVALQSVMVLPDVTLPPPDEDPLLYFDETIDSEEGSESGASSDKNPAEHDTLLANGESSTDQTVDEELFDALVDDLEDEIKATDAAFPTSGSPSPSSASTVTSGDADVEPDGDEHDVDADDEIDAASMPSAQRRRRRMLSGNCNIFDCCFRNICVEIKPKIGFKPRGKLVADVRKRVCRFCMHQHYKRATGKVEEISEYCPLDLFSRDADRIRRALRALQRTPQNNFKVFVRSNNDDVVDVITGLGTDALPKGVAAQTKHSCRRKRMGFRHSCQSIGTENELHVQQDENDHLLPDVVELLTDVLLNLNILEDLKQIQLLDHVGVDGMWHLQKLIKWVQPFADGDQQLTLRALVDRVRDSLPVDTPQHESEQGSLSRCVAYLEVALDEVPDMGLHDNLSWAAMTLGRLESFYEQLLQRFQVATTLKDCSLLLCLRRAVDGDEAAVLAAVPPVHHHPVCPTKSSSSLLLPASLVGSRQTFDHLREYEHRVEFRDMVFNCVVAIVDLDVKSHKSVDDYHRLDDKIVQHYVRTFGDKLQYDTCCE